MSDRKLKSIVGCLLGTAVGDALGLPYEGLSRNKIYRFHTPIQGHSWILNKAMISDDTEQTCMVAQSLIVSAGETGQFSHYLAWRLRFWLLGFPASIKLATLKSAFRLLIGYTPQTSGVDSARNSAAIRSGIIGVCYGDEPVKLLTLVQASTIITHDNSKAKLGAIAIAVAAYMASRQSNIKPSEYYLTLQRYLLDYTAEPLKIETAAFLSLIKQVCLSVEQKESGVAFASKLANNFGINPHTYDTVSMVIQVWLRNQNSYSNGIREIIYLGGDTKTTAGILGGIIGASVGAKGIPKKWLDDIIDFPRSINWIAALGQRLSQVCNEKNAQSPLTLAIYLIPLRNLIFLLVALFRAFYRLLPPY